MIDVLLLISKIYNTDYLEEKTGKKCKRTNRTKE